MKNMVKNEIVFLMTSILMLSALHVVLLYKLSKTLKILITKLLDFTNACKAAHFIADQVSGA